MTQLYLVRGFNPPVIVVKRSGGVAYVVPASLPWACSSIVRTDQLVRLAPTAQTTAVQRDT